MESLAGIFYHDGKLFGIEWHDWKVVGWCGNFIFTARFVIQWIATEKHKRVVVPSVFWWASILGSLCLLSYALFHQKDSVFIFAYAFSWIPYVRNLIIHRRHKNAHVDCHQCAASAPPQAKYCCECGARLSG